MKAAQQFQSLFKGFALNRTRMSSHSPLLQRLHKQSHTYTHTHTHTHTQTHTNTNTNTNTSTHTHTNTHTQTDTRARARARAHQQTYLCAHRNTPIYPPRTHLFNCS